jgi:gluconate 2-dehydrogenase gamma chain
MPNRAEPPEDALLTRRAALARTAAMLGSALAAPTIAGVLAGCGDRASRTDTNGVTPLKAMTSDQEQLVAAVTSVILPTTTTPGAREAGVSRFIDRMLAEYYSERERTRVIGGLERLDARARAQHTQPFVSCTAAQQFALVDALDALAFDGPARVVASPAMSSPDSAATAPADPDDIGPQSFFRLLKELTLAGYYTSEIGATRELRVNPMGRWRADVPYSDIGASWA